MTTRYAVYFAPAPDTALCRFGSGVLGYDAASGSAMEQLVPAGFDPSRWRALTADPRRYGFHATLKAPFRLAEGRGEEALGDALRDFAAGRRSFALPRLAVTAIRSGNGNGFAALAEPAPTPALLLLEAAIVDAFEPFRGAAQRGRDRETPARRAQSPAAGPSRPLRLPPRA